MAHSASPSTEGTRARRFRFHARGYFLKHVDVERWHVELPGPADVRWLALAPDGGRLSWLVRAFTHLEDPAQLDWDYRLLVSGARGDNLVQVGALATDIRTLKRDECFSRKRPVPCNFCWSPSGAELAFVFDGNLYVRPT